MSTIQTHKNTSEVCDVEVAIVGGGIGGLYALHRLRKQGLRCRLYEAGGGVGGTWYWNRYPGARVDIESVEYSYSFSDDIQQEWDWSERYPSQSEVLRYINFVADRLNLRPDIQLNTHIASAEFDEATDTWVITTGDGGGIRAKYCVLAVGVLSARNLPNIAGLDTFAGELHHTGSWPHEGVDFTGKRVGLIGTGASGVQITPIVAEQADQLFVFQRSAHWCVPLRNVPMPSDYLRSVKENYAEWRRKEHEIWGGFVAVDFGIGEACTKRALEVTPEERLAEYEYRWNSGGLSFYHSFQDLLFEKEANDTMVEFFKEKIRKRIKDPDTAEALIPTDHPIMTRRLCGETNYYDAYNRDNVTLVNVKNNPIVEVTAGGLTLNDGTEFNLDVIICATGYDAATGPLLRMNISGRGGKELKEHWAAGPRTHLGLMSHGFPNMFFVDGPQTVSAFFLPFLLCQYQGNWIGDRIAYLDARGLSSIEPTSAAETEWSEHVDAVASQTLLPQANSWYMGANIPGKPRKSLFYLGGFTEYRRRCEVAASEPDKEYVLEPAKVQLQF